MAILFIPRVEEDSFFLVLVALHVLSGLLLNLVVLVVFQHMHVIRLLLLLGYLDLLLHINLCLRGHESVIYLIF